MVWLYIGIILLFRVVQAFFSKRSSLEIQNTRILIGFHAFQYSISALLGLLLLLFGSADFTLEPLTVLIAAFSGLSLFFSGFCSLYAMKSGTVSLNSMFGTAGMIIPIVAGALLFDNPVAPLQLVGLLLFFLAAYLLIGDSKTVYAAFNYKTLLLLCGSLVANGCTMLAQQLFTRYVPQGDVSAFSFLSFGIIALLSAILYKTPVHGESSRKAAMPRPLFLCGIALAVSVFVINQLATISTALISPVILFAFINGTGTIISTIVAAVVYKERIRYRTGVGILLGIASLMLIKLFEHGG